MVGEWIGAINDMLEGRDSEAAKRLSNSLPIGWMSLFGLDQDAKGIFRETLSGN
jgi:hypothetical protein